MALSNRPRPSRENDPYVTLAEEELDAASRKADAEALLDDHAEVAFTLSYVGTHVKGPWFIYRDNTGARRIFTAEELRAGEGLQVQTGGKTLNVSIILHDDPYLLGKGTINTKALVEEARRGDNGRDADRG